MTGALLDERAQGVECEPSRAYGQSPAASLDDARSACLSYALGLSDWQVWSSEIAPESSKIDALARRRPREAVNFFSESCVWAMMPTSTHALIVAAGVYDLAFAAFHLGLPLIFRWRWRLAKLDPLNRAIVHTLNFMLIFVLVAAGILLAYGSDLLISDRLGRGFLFLSAGFWAVRAAFQPVLFGLQHWASKLMFCVFLFGVALHAAPAWP